MAATDPILRLGSFRVRPILSKIVRSLLALLASLGLYVVTGFLLIAFFIGNLAGGAGANEWSDTFTKVFLGTLAFHALIVVLGSAWLARLFTAPVLPVLLATAAVLATPWVVSAVFDSGSRELPNPSPKPGDHVERTPPRSGSWTIEEAQQFDGYALFWVGPEYAGLPITKINRLQHSAAVQGVNEDVTLFYGTCKPTSETGCFPPMQITIAPYCEEDHLHAWATTTPLRGGAEMTGATDVVRVWTADASIRISTPNAQQAARALVALNRPSPATASDPLPAVSAEC